MILQQYPNPLYWGHDVRLSVERSSSSYRVPVLVIDGISYGSGDLLPNELTGADYVRRFDRLDPVSDLGEVSRETRERHALIDLFCGVTTPLPTDF